MKSKYDGINWERVALHLGVTVEEAKAMVEAEDKLHDALDWPVKE